MEHQKTRGVVVIHIIFYAMGKHLKHHKFDDGITLAVCQICGQSSCYREYHHAGVGYEYTTIDMPFKAEKFLVEGKLQTAYKLLVG